MLRQGLCSVIRKDIGALSFRCWRSTTPTFHHVTRTTQRRRFPLPSYSARLQQTCRAYCSRKDGASTADGTPDPKGEDPEKVADSAEARDNDAQDKSELQFEPGPIGTINKSIYDQPLETLAGVISMEMVTIYGLHAMLKYSGVDVPADLAVAFILSRPLRRVRLPLELAVASVLARAAPALTRIHVMHIFRAFPGYQEPDWMKDGGKTADGAMQKGVAKLTSAIDKFGAAYTVGSRVTGVCIIAAIYVGLRNGVDVSALLQTYGFAGAEKAGSMLSTWAGAVLLSSVLFPVNAYMGARIAPYYRRMRTALVP